MYKASNSRESELVAIDTESPSMNGTTSAKQLKVEHAVILAAGNGERFQEKGVKLPKVLLKVGGLRLLERAVLALNQVGVKHFYIVVW